MSKNFPCLLWCAFLFISLGHLTANACTSSQVAGTWVSTYITPNGPESYTNVLQIDGSILGVPTSEETWSVTGNRFIIYDNEFCPSGRPISGLEATLNNECNFMSGLYFNLEAATKDGVEEYCRHDGTTTSLTSRKLQGPEPYFGPWTDNRTIASCNSDCIKRVEQSRICIGGDTCIGPTIRIVTRNCEPGEGMCPADNSILPVLFLLLLSDEPNEFCTTGGIYDCKLNCISESTRDSWVGDGSCDDGAYQNVDLITNESTSVYFNCPGFNNDGGDCN